VVVSHKDKQKKPKLPLDIWSITKIIVTAKQTRVKLQEGEEGTLTLRLCRFHTKLIASC